MRIQGMVWALSLVVFGCEKGGEPASTPLAPPPVVQAEPALEPVSEAPAAPPEPTEEEKKRAEAAAALAADRAKDAELQSAELARFTPELRAQAQKLAEGNYATARAALTPILKSPVRKPGNPERDQYRHPLETLVFFGFKPNQSVLEIGPGEGWYTELLAPALAKSGKLYITAPDPDGPPEERTTLYGERAKLLLARSPELYGKVERLVVDPKDPKLPLDGQLDLVLLARGLHGFVNANQVDVWLAEIHRALKPNGILAIEQHRAAPGADPQTSSKQGYLPEAWVIEKIGSAGFKLAGKSELNANPKDTKDYPAGVWALPPTLRVADPERDKHLAIGESDRMTLKFTKIAK